MANNSIPEAYDPLVELMEDAADGAAAHGAAVSLKQNLETNIRTDLEALIGVPAVDPRPAKPGLKALLNAAKANKTTKTAALRTACSNGRALAMACIGTLKPVLGNVWGSAWNAAGFTESSLSVPTNPMVKLQQLRAYYGTNPTREVPNVNGIACTAAACEVAAQAISTAQTASNQSNTDAGTAQGNFDAGMVTARRRMSGLLSELTQLLSDEDVRWYAFGFDRPSDSSAPDVPENLTATPGAPGSRTLILHCDTARRAINYRFVIKNAAGDTKLTEELSAESQAILRDLPGGATVTITVSAKNSTGESQPCTPITAVVP